MMCRLLSLVQEVKTQISDNRRCCRLVCRGQCNCHGHCDHPGSPSTLASPSGLRETLCMLLHIVMRLAKVMTLVSADSQGCQKYGGYNQRHMNMQLHIYICIYGELGMHRFLNLTLNCIYISQGHVLPIYNGQVRLD